MLPDLSVKCRGNCKHQGCSHSQSLYSDYQSTSWVLWIQNAPEKKNIVTAELLAKISTNPSVSNNIFIWDIFARVYIVQKPLEVLAPEFFTEFFSCREVTNLHGLELSQMNKMLKAIS